MIEQVGKIIDDIYEKATLGMSTKASKFQYDIFMDIARQQINDFGLRPAHFGHKTFALVPFYAWGTPQTKMEDVSQGWGPRALDDIMVCGLINCSQSTNRR